MNTALTMSGNDLHTGCVLSHSVLRTPPQGRWFRVLATRKETEAQLSFGSSAGSQNKQVAKLALEPRESGSSRRVPAPYRTALHCGVLPVFLSGFPSGFLVCTCRSFLSLSSF